MGKLSSVIALLTILTAWAALQFAFIKVDDSFWKLSSCPACYGQVNCHQIQTDLTFPWTVRNLINVKNVYFGHLLNREVVIKKLAHTSELDSFDKIICKRYSKEPTCNVRDVWTSLVNDKYHLFKNDSVKTLRNLVQELKPEAEAEEFETGAISCLSDNLLKMVLDQFQKSETTIGIANAAFTLLINPEPIIQQILVDRMPNLYGICGRVIVEEYVGPTLTEFYHSKWIIRLKLAASLIELANELSFHEPTGFAFYLTDVSFDNFAVSQEKNNYRVKLVDGESVVVVDLNSTENKSDELHVHNNNNNVVELSENELSFSIDDLCSASSSDHNLYAISKCLLSEKPCSPGFSGGLLREIPDHIEAQWKVKSLVDDIINGYNNRLETGAHFLQTVKRIVQSTN
ncbi:hypothetical protein CHUAL_002895 [Chamberlinius hualienensis]